MSIELSEALPRTLPITVEQYRILVERDTFADRVGQVELIYGKIVEMNPQGPQHSDPVDELTDWSIMEAGRKFRVRIEKPIEIPALNSSPEPDIAWVTRRRYSNRHPLPEDIHLLIEVSLTSRAFDRAEKRRLYAEASIREYWIVDVASQTVEVMTHPVASDYQQSNVYHGEGEVSPAFLPTATLLVSRLFSDSVQ